MRQPNPSKATSFPHCSWILRQHFGAQGMILFSLMQKGSAVSPRIHRGTQKPQRSPRNLLINKMSYSCTLSKGAGGLIKIVLDALTNRAMLMHKGGRSA